MDYAVRFLAGGLIASAFAVLGDVLRPRIFAGLFAVSPSIALATLTIAIFKNSAAYVATDGSSMALGALAILIYSCVVCRFMMRLRIPAVTATGSALAIWLLIACGPKRLVLG